MVFDFVATRCVIGTKVMGFPWSSSQNPQKGIPENSLGEGSENPGLNCGGSPLKSLENLVSLYRNPNPNCHRTVRVPERARVWIFHF